MDQMRIESDFMQGILAHAVATAILKKSGIVTSLEFNDPISITFDGEQAMIHISADARISKENLIKLATDFI